MRASITSDIEKEIRKHPSPKERAEAMRVANFASFMTRFLSGNPNVTIHYEHGPYHEFSTSPLPDGFLVRLPRWEDYNLPLEEYDKYRIFMHGVWHEASHIRYTPRLLFHGRVLDNFIFNIFEDGRITDLGVEQWPGFLPEQLYVQAYAYAVRPEVDKIIHKEARMLEALLQLYLIGKIKGNLPPEEEERVKKCVGFFKKKKEELKQRAPTPEDKQEIVNEAIKILGIDPNYYPDKEDSWESTFTPFYVEMRKKEEGKSEEEFEKEVKERMEKFFEEKKKEAKDLKEGEEKRDPLMVTKDDVEKAKEGTAETKRQYENIKNNIAVDDAEREGFLPVPSRTRASEYIDQQFIRTMAEQLAEWKAGFKKIVGESGASFSVKEYLRSKGEKPFVTRIKKSVHGRKILIIADFSASMRPREGDYKKAIISAIEALDNIGANVALFSFASDPSYGDGFFKIKAFEEGKWRGDHAAKLASLRADYPVTPLGGFYEQLENYVKKHRPLVTITVTDGAPQDEERAKNAIARWKKYTRMIAFGLPDEPDGADVMRRCLKDLGYHSYTVVNNLRDLPTKLVRAIAPE